MFSNSAFAYGSSNIDDFNEHKSKYRVLYGLILLIGGGVLAYDGFRSVKIDISKPGFEITGSGSWEHSGVPGSITLKSEGTITNTGNVTYKMVAFDVRYCGGGSYAPSYYYPNPGLGSAGYFVMLDNSSAVYYSLAPGQSVSWKNAAHDELNSQNSGQFPNGDYGTTYTYPNLKDNIRLLDFTYGANPFYNNYERKYKTEMNNVYEGIAGVLLAGAGIYLLVDYVVGLKKFDYYMKKNDMNLYVINDSEEFKLMFAKRI
jgi:hypothetical protein